MFTDLDPSLLDDPGFKEDSVREVIITPLLTRLGYSPSGPNRIARSKSLTHAFIYAGTRRVPVTLIADYTLFSEQTALLVLDAKRPAEDILSRENVQQVYSYAIHPEIRAQHFALCNGKMLVVFSVDSDEPSLAIPFSEFDSRWEEIERCLSAKYLKDPVLRNFAPDFGIALARLGLAEGTAISFFPAKLNVFAKLDDNTVTASANVQFADRPHCVSFDFDRALLPEILGGIPSDLAELFTKALSRAPFQAAAELVIELDVDSKLGPEIRGQSEVFRPLVIQRVLAARFNPFPGARASGIPDHIFRLRDAYTLECSDSDDP